MGQGYSRADSSRRRRYASASPNASPDSASPNSSPEFSGSESESEDRSNTSSATRTNVRTVPSSSSRSRNTVPAFSPKRWPTQPSPHQIWVPPQGTLALELDERQKELATHDDAIRSPPPVTGAPRQRTPKESDRLMGRDISTEKRWSGGHGYMKSSRRPEQPTSQSETPPANDLMSRKAPHSRSTDSKEDDGELAFLRLLEQKSALADQQYLIEENRKLEEEQRRLEEIFRKEKEEEERDQKRDNEEHARRRLTLERERRKLLVRELEPPRLQDAKKKAREIEARSKLDLWFNDDLLDHGTEGESEKFKQQLLQEKLGWRREVSDLRLNELLSLEEQREQEDEPAINSEHGEDQTQLKEAYREQSPLLEFSKKLEEYHRLTSQRRAEMPEEEEEGHGEEVEWRDSQETGEWGENQGVPGCGRDYIEQGSSQGETSIKQRKDKGQDSEAQKNRSGSQSDDDNVGPSTTAITGTSDLLFSSPPIASGINRAQFDDRSDQLSRLPAAELDIEEGNSEVLGNRSGRYAVRRSELQEKRLERQRRKNINLDEQKDERRRGAERDPHEERDVKEKFEEDRERRSQCNEEVEDECQIVVVESTTTRTSSGSSTPTTPDSYKRTPGSSLTEDGSLMEQRVLGPPHQQLQSASGILDEGSQAVLYCLGSKSNGKNLASRPTYEHLSEGSVNPLGSVAPAILAELAHLGLSHSIVFKDGRIVGGGTYGDVTIGTCRVADQRDITVVIKRLRFLISSLQTEIRNTKAKYHSAMEQAQRDLATANRDRAHKLADAQHEVDNAECALIAGVKEGQHALDEAEAAMNRMFGQVHEDIENARRDVQSLQNEIDGIYETLHEYEHAPWYEFWKKAAIAGLYIEVAAVEAAKVVADGVLQAAEAVLESQRFVTTKLGVESARRALDVARRGGEATLEGAKAILHEIDVSTGAAVRFAQEMVAKVEEGTEWMAFDGATRALEAYKEASDAMYQNARNAIDGLATCAEFIAYHAALGGLELAQSLSLELEAAKKTLEILKEGADEALEIGKWMSNYGTAIFDIQKIHLSGSLRNIIGDDGKQSNPLRAEVEFLLIKEKYHFDVEYAITGTPGLPFSSPPIVSSINRTQFDDRRSDQLSRLPATVLDIEEGDREEPGNRSGHNAVRGPELQVKRLEEPKRENMNLDEQKRERQRGAERDPREERAMREKYEEDREQQSQRNEEVEDECQIVVVESTTTSTSSGSSTPTTPDSSNRTPGSSLTEDGSLMEQRVLGPPHQQLQGASGILGEEPQAVVYELGSKTNGKNLASRSTYEHLSEGSVNPLGSVAPAILTELAHLDLSRSIVFKDGRIVGGGTYGDVTIGTCRVADQRDIKVAVKRLRFWLQGDIKMLFEREIYVWSKLSHPNVLPLLGYAIDDTSGFPLLISRWMENGSAWKYVTNHPSCDVIKLIVGIADGLSYLHSLGVVHSDIKSDNIMVSDVGDALICDFGCSRMVDSSRTYAKLTSSVKGTSRYLAYELVVPIGQGEGFPGSHTAKTDVWAFGMTVFELCTHQRPYASLRDTQIGLAIWTGDLPEFPSTVPSNVDTSILDRIKTICSDCWKHDPSQRPSMQSIFDELAQVSGRVRNQV